MSRNYNRVLRAVALTAAFAAQMGGTALARSHSEGSRKPTMALLEREVERERLRLDRPSNLAIYERSLPRHQAARLAIHAAKLVDGKPDPSKADWLDIQISPRTEINNPAVPPQVEITFTKLSNNTWDARSMTEVHGTSSPRTYYILEETAEASVDEATAVFTADGFNQTITSSTPGRSGAVRFLRDLQLEAQHAILGIEHGQIPNS